MSTPRIYFSLGHNACRSCSERSRLDPSCAECRKPKGVPHRIYLSSDDFVDQPAGRIIDDLNGINTEDPAESIAGAGERIRRFNDMVKGNRDVSVRSIVVYFDITSTMFNDREHYSPRQETLKRE